VGESDLAELAAKFAAHGGGRVSPELSADLALEVVLNEIVEQACLATGATGAAIVLERGEEWVCRASAGGNAPQLGARLDTEAGLSGACVKTRTVQRCDDAQNDPRADMEACRILGVRSVIVLPLLQNGELVGVFELFSEWPSAFGERDERTLEALSLRIFRNLERASEPMAGSVEPGESVGQVEENSVATSDGSYSDRGSVRLPVVQMASETAFGRGINLVTWILGAIVLGFAVLLTVLVDQRLGGGKARAHAPISAPLAGAGGQSTARSSGTPGPTTPLSSGNRSAEKGNARTPPAGSLLVYENGKEVFRLPPTAVQGEATTATGTQGTAATSTDATEMQRASAVEPAGTLEVSPEVAEGSLLYRVEPDYPEEARQQQIQGPVVLDVRAGRDGTVQEVKLLSGQRLLADAAIAAVKQWRFRPRVVNGQAVEMQTKVTLNFKLPH
jgi:TonB family protein